MSRDELLELYKVADQNHRFYVDKRFTIISFYLPLATLASTGIYTLTNKHDRTIVSLVAFALTVFLYCLEYRNWILSNECAKNCKMLEWQIGGSLHQGLADSYTLSLVELPEGSTEMDELVRPIGGTQHRAVSWLTAMLLIYWYGLALIALSPMNYENIVKWLSKIVEYLTRLS